jgi:hypothetical protein
VISFCHHTNNKSVHYYIITAVSRAASPAAASVFDSRFFNAFRSQASVAGNSQQS